MIDDSRNMIKEKSIRFLCNCDWQEMLAKLPDTSKLKIYEAMFDYARTGETKGLDLIEEVPFNFIKDEIDRYLGNYKNKCEINKKIAQKRESEKKVKRTCTNEGNPSPNPNPNPNPSPNPSPNPDIFYNASESACAPALAPAPAQGKRKRNSSQSYGLTEIRLQTLVQDDTPYGKFNKWLIVNAPYILDHFDKLIANFEYDKIISRYSLDALCATILEIENRVDLRKKYSNLYLTVLRWIRMGYEPYK